MSIFNIVYAGLLKDTVYNGVWTPPAREGMPSTKKIFGRTFYIPVSEDDFPILLGKKVSFYNIKAELLWFLKGCTNVNDLQNCHIWDDDCYKFYVKNEKEKGLIPFNKEEWSKLKKEKYHFMGNCGRIYGHQWRNYGRDNYNIFNKPRKAIDQIKILIEGLQNNPFSRYHIVDSWNPQDFYEGYQALPACHTNFICNVKPNDKGKNILNLMYVQRSCDLPLGVPYNVSSYALLMLILCKICNLKSGVLTVCMGDIHYYENQQEYVKEYLKRYDDNIIPSDKVKLIINDFDSKFLKNDVYDYTVIDSLKIEDFRIENYKPLSAIKAPLSVGI